MFAGPWSASVSDNTFAVLLLLFGAATLVAVCSAWLLWQRRRIGTVLNLTALPVEAIFRIGFALPLPWVAGIARVVLVVVAWNSLSKSGRQAESALNATQRSPTTAKASNFRNSWAQRRRAVERPELGLRANLTCVTSPLTTTRVRDDPAPAARPRAWSSCGRASGSEPSGC